MGAAPQELTIAAVGEVDGQTKVKIVGQGDTAFGLSPKGAVEPTQGLQFRGWVNMQGNWGPWVKVAEERDHVDQGNGSQTAPAPAQQGFAQQPVAPVPMPQTPPQRDPKDVSIERQVASKCAAQVLAAHYPSIPDEAFATEVGRVVNAFADAIAKSDADIPW